MLREKRRRRPVTAPIARNSPPPLPIRRRPSSAARRHRSPLSVRRAARPAAGPSRWFGRRAKAGVLSASALCRRVEAKVGSSVAATGAAVAGTGPREAMPKLARASSALLRECEGR
jgi:hypothetical protein